MTVFKTIIGILEGPTDKVKEVCEDIKSRDKTFDYTIVKPKVESLKCKFENLLILRSATEKEANSRGGWFIHKCKNAKVSSYFWIKEG